MSLYSVKFSNVVLGAILAAGLSYTSLSAEVIEASNPNEILNVAKGFGSGTLTKDSEGDPKISGRIDGIAYAILFYGCKNHTKCQEIQFRAGWSGKSIDLAKINEWNRTKRFGKAYLDSDNDPNVEMSVNMTKGVTRANLEDNFSSWSSAMSSFRDYISD